MEQVPVQPVAKAEAAGSLVVAEASEAASNSISNTIVSPSPPVKVVCVSGTFNPPHRGHALIGIHAANQLRCAGMTVACIVFLPVHDNYLWNKLTPSTNRKIARGDPAPICLPMDTRVKLLKEILGKEETDFECHVLPFERDHAAAILKKTAYWERTLGDAQLPTVATSDMLHLFGKTWVSKHFGPEARLSLVFGIDNLPWMPSWANAEALFSSCDLVLVRRLEAASSDVDTIVQFRVDPTVFMRNFKTIRVESINPIVYEGNILFGDRLGESTPKCCSPEAMSTLYIVAPLDGLPGLSSTVMRRAIKVLAMHGYTSASLATALMKFCDKGKQTLDSIREKHDAASTTSDKA